MLFRRLYFLRRVIRLVINDKLLWLIRHLMLVLSGDLNRRHNYSLFISEIHLPIATQLLLTELLKRIIAQLPYLVSI